MQLRRFGWPLMGGVLVIGGWAAVLREMSPQPVAPDYTEIEPGLYVGARVDMPPADAGAVLNLCEQPDAYHTVQEKFSPIPDAAPAPSLAWLREQVDFIKTQRAAGRVVFVHCNAGKSRSAMVAAAYLMERDHLSAEEAVKKLRAKRPVARPIPAFMELLGEWGLGATGTVPANQRPL